MTGDHCSGKQFHCWKRKESWNGRSLVPYHRTQKANMYCTYDVVPACLVQMRIVNRHIGIRIPTSTSTWREMKVTPSEVLLRLILCTPLTMAISSARFGSLRLHSRRTVTTIRAGAFSASAPTDPQDFINSVNNDYERLHKSFEHQFWGKAYERKIILHEILE